MLLFFLVEGGTVGCRKQTESPQAVFDSATEALRHGQARVSQDRSAQAYQQHKKSNSTWAWKFLILEAQAALERGLNDEVLKLIEKEDPPPGQPDLAIPRFTLLGIAKANKNDFPEAKRWLDKATKLCDSNVLPSCGYVLQARGLLASEQADSRTAEMFFESSLAFARTHGDSFLEANSLLNLGAESLSQGSYDEAIERSEAGYQIARAARAGILELDTQGNVGWAYYKLGEADRALERFIEAEKRASELGDVADQGAWLTNAGYVYLDAHNFELAGQYFQRALQLEQAPGVDSQEHIYNAYRALARLALQTGALDQATQYADQALGAAQKSNNRAAELYPLLVQGQIAVRRGNTSDAERIFHEVESDKLCPAFLKWESQHSLAALYESRHQPDAGDREYRLAISTFEAARADVRHEDSVLSFLTNGWRIYDDYVHFLVARGKAEEALRWADQSRARTLAEGLGFLNKGMAVPRQLNASQIARQNQGTVLYYWLGEKQSFVWAITPRQTKLFPLPPADQIDAAVQRYRSALAGPQDVLASGDNDGRWLYSTLVAPVQSLLAQNGSVFVVPDGSLNNLNFETLLVSEPKLHYWIEDATVSNASSLLTLGSSYVPGKKQSRSLLLLGNSVPASDKFPPLPRAGSQMEAIAEHFPLNDRLVLSREKATPAAYLDSHPEQFTHIHFVAHGTASRLSPLDSAIILSPTGADHEAFKLYARQIISHPLRADLVTISACNGSGDRSYKGEGLVGLSWAFLRAGAHNVVAALWEVEDTSVEKLMTRFYDELDRGASPSTALRTAKLSLLRSDALANPFYWAPFQLYTQGGVPARSASNVALLKTSPLSLKRNP